MKHNARFFIPNGYLYWQPIGAGLTFDPSRLGADLVLSNGNKTVSNLYNTWYSAVSTAAAPANVMSYCEYTITTASPNAGYQVFGICDNTFNVNGALGAAISIGYTINTGQRTLNGVSNDSTPNSTLIQGDVVGILIDNINKRLYMSKNGSWFHSGNPKTNTGYIAHSLPTSVYPAISILNGVVLTANFGANSFAYPPS